MQFCTIFGKKHKANLGELGVLAAILKKSVVRSPCGPSIHTPGPAASLMYRFVPWRLF
jgi:hypothetical protein